MLFFSLLPPGCQERNEAKFPSPQEREWALQLLVKIVEQIDKKKERSITKDALQGLLTSLKCENKSVEEIMERLDTDEDGVRSSCPCPGLFPGSLSHRNVASQTVSEKEWLEGLSRCQDLKAALEADIDPDTGKLKSLDA